MIYLSRIRVKQIPITTFTAADAAVARARNQRLRNGRRDCKWSLCDGILKRRRRRRTIVQLPIRLDSAHRSKVAGSAPALRTQPVHTVFRHGWNLIVVGKQQRSIENKHMLHLVNCAGTRQEKGEAEISPHEARKESDMMTSIPLRPKRLLWCGGRDRRPGC